ncbi:NUDIX domain-containing protein [Echria macrotheca]|uniref:NUDIX domain-containing protein n=1 Tax=Echria macrotheca TaxID=438768 RepID=A0AAJ0F8A9_9PEZI|nr:NUDIX domain-containing protein [Echria macrotheca]
MASPALTEQLQFFRALVEKVDNVRDEDLKLKWKLRFPHPYDDRIWGYPDDDVVTELLQPSDKYIVDETCKCVYVKDSSEGRDTANAISQAFQEITDAAIKANKFANVLHGRHSEKHSIAGAEEIEFERFTTPLLGLATKGVSVIAYELNPDLSFNFWVQHRGLNVFSPNMLDVTVAGCVRARQEPWDSIVEEAKEEASFTEKQLREHATEIEELTYYRRIPETGMLIFGIMYSYDMLLPEGVEPVPSSPEVTEFQRMSTQELIEAMKRGRFRPGANPLIIDFFIRHKIIPEDDDLVRRLHRPLPVPS